MVKGVKLVASFSLFSNACVVSSGALDLFYG